MGLEEDYKKFFSEHEVLEKYGQELVSLVLDHFNDYVKTSINPQLPEGFSITLSDHAFYSNGKFVISTGHYQTPSGPTTEPLEIETTVMDLLRDYQKKTPWIDRIQGGFSLST
jgi:hypothetical protein